jgi:hypothetical protein
MHLATSREVEGLISIGVSEILYYLNPFGRAMVLGSSQPVTEMSTMDFP